MWIEFSDFLREYFPEGKVQKITISAGFSCPTRDGSKGKGGCTYCNNKSFSPAHAIRLRGITEQLDEGIAFFRRKYKDMRFLAYFQSYTNTYGDIADCISKYEEAISHPDVVGIIIGTRPDCMPEDLLKYLAELSKRTFVLVEYGVESTINRTLERIQRGHDWECSRQTILRTAQAGVLVGAHLILGLPGESREEVLSHAVCLSELPITTLKLHQLQIIKGTIMAGEYLKDPGQFHLFTEEEYVRLCVDFLDKLRPGIVVERFVSQSPPELILAPRWGWKNYQFVERIRAYLRERDTRASDPSPTLLR